MFWREDAPPLNAPTPEPTPLAITDFAPGSIVGLEITETETGQRLRLVKSDDTWQMQSPAQGEAYSPRVDSLTFQLAQVRANRKLEQPASLTDFGLEPPLYELKLTLEGGNSETLQLGGQNPDKNFYYAMKTGDSGVYLISSTTGDAIKDLVAMPPYTPTPTVVMAATLTPEPTITPSP
jgi:hypothetical protein